MSIVQDGYTPLHLAARGGHITCVDHLLTTPGIDVNIKNVVSWCNEFFNVYCMSFRNMYMYMYVLIKRFGRGCMCP